MTKLLFLLVWLGLFVVVGMVSWKKIESNLKVYLVILYNGVFLAGLFLLYAHIP